MIDSDLLYQLIGLLVTAAITIVVPILRRYLLVRFSAEQLAAGAEVARIVVRAVEQTVTAVHGEDKLAEAIRRAKVYASAIGLRFTDEQWKHLIEQAVLNMNREWNAPKVLEAQLKELDAGVDLSEEIAQKVAQKVAAALQRS